MIQLKIFLLSSMVVIFTACGGGGGSSSENNTPKTEVIASAYSYSLGIYDQNKTIYTYDENGALATSSASIKMDNILMGYDLTLTGLPLMSDFTIEHTYTYDYENNEVIVGPEGTYEGQTVCTFNEDGYYTECHTDVSSIEYFYDDFNRLEKIVGIYEYIDYSGKIETIYNTEGKPIESIFSFTKIDSNLSFDNFYYPYDDGMVQYTYYPNGFISILTYTANENSSQTTTTYDETKHGRALNTVEEHIDGTVRTYTYNYHSNGIINEHIVRTDNSDGSWEECTYTYDENFELISEVCDSGTNII